MPSVTYKAAGSMDLSFPSRSATVTPTFRNYNGGITDYEYTVTELKGSTVVKEDVSDAFTLEQSGKSFRIRCTDAAVSTANTYQLKLRLFLEDSSCVENTINLKVKRTAVKLKLSKTKLTLNKLTGDKGTVTVSCATSGYDFTEPVIILSGSAEGKLDVAYENGRLTVATNKNTQYGKTYRITLKADPYAPSSTLTVTIPTIAKSEVTASLKVSGKIDVIRAGSKATVTPSYKNCLNTAEAEEELIIYNSKKAKVNDLFHIEPNGKGGYTITQAEGARLTAGTYKVKLLATIGDVPVESKQISLTVSMAAPKLTVKTSNTTLFAKDGNDRALVRFVAKDTTLNQVTQVRIKDSKYQDKFEIIACGNGEFAIAFRDGKVHRSLVGKTVTLTLNVFLEGNQTSKANTTAKVKLTIVK